ncbi:hypothetical protein PWY87_33295 [Kribbella solani]|uniref:hypothetical protein n=1 Tax=Kribbella solani TaxID=236067 RepID=UPI0029A814CD|nr:hypothetical protein [Kribbella solani]MDX2970557.1 hypothetical protein [Kribbella solani]MDX3006598.1 hypothetical protein [Kribbella solani]
MKPSGPDRLPRWNTQTITPNMTAKLSRFNTVDFKRWITELNQALAGYLTPLE